MTKRYYANVAGVALSGEKPPVSYFVALMHMIKGYIGTGIFALGNAFHNTGMICGPILLILMGLVNVYCQHLLVYSAERLAEKEQEDVRPSLAETVQYTIEDGPDKWKRHAKGLSKFFNSILIFAEISFCSVYYLFAAAHIIQIIDYFCDVQIHINLMLAICLIPFWIMAFIGTLHDLYIFSMTANFLTYIIVGFIFYYTTQDLVPISSRPAIVEDKLRMPLAFGTLIFAFEGVAFILPLRGEMKDVRHFNCWWGVLNVGFFIVVSLTETVGILSYWKYGDDIKGSVLLNLPRETLGIATKCLVTISICCSYVLHMYITTEVAFPQINEAWGPFERVEFAKFVSKSVFVLLCFISANASPFLEHFISLSGNIFGSMLALIMPPLTYLLNFPEQNVGWKILHWIIVVFGCTCAMFSVVNVYFIVDSFKHDLDKE